jgi:membrane protein required for beta-lactamase induction
MNKILNALIWIAVTAFFAWFFWTTPIAILAILLFLITGLRN